MIYHDCNCYNWWKMKKMGTLWGSFFDRVTPNSTIYMLYAVEKCNITIKVLNSYTFKIKSAKP